MQMIMQVHKLYSSLHSFTGYADDYAGSQIIQLTIQLHRLCKLLRSNANYTAHCTAAQIKQIIQVTAQVKQITAQLQ